MKEKPTIVFIKVELTAEQVAVAKTMGVPLEVYAREFLYFTIEDEHKRIAAARRKKTVKAKK